MVVADVDCFKRFNDRYGHQAGADCLRRVAAAMPAAMQRPGAMLARYGGEEFACVLPETDLAGAMKVARELGAHVDAEQIEHGDSEAAPGVGIGLGVSTLRDCARGSPGELLRSADQQLFAAKSLGRDRACCAVCAGEPQVRPDPPNIAPLIAPD